MTNHNGHYEEPKAPTTPFDEATDLVDSDEELTEIRGLRMPPVRALVILVGIILSPLFGLVFGLDFALAVLVFAMAVTTWLAWEGSKRLVPEQSDRLRKAAMLNGALAVVVLLLLVVRVTGFV